MVEKIIYEYKKHGQDVPAIFSEGVNDVNYCTLCFAEFLEKKIGHLEKVEEPALEKRIANKSW